MPDDFNPTKWITTAEAAGWGVVEVAPAWMVEEILNSMPQEAAEADFLYTHMFAGRFKGGFSMSIELEIAQGLATLKLNLGEFLAVAQQIAGVTKHREARQALKGAIGEIRKSCDTAVDVFTPLYGLTDEASFTKNFGGLHASFKNSYLKNVGAVRTHCTVVKTHLEALLKKKEWLGGLPLLERSYARLQELCDHWLFSDYTLAEQMDSFLKRIDTFYADLSDLAQSDASTAFAVLRSGLHQYEDDFLSLRKQLDALDELGRTL